MKNEMNRMDENTREKTGTTNLRRLAKSIRELNSTLMAFEGPDEDYDALCKTIDSFTARLSTLSPRKRTYEKRILFTGKKNTREIQYGNLHDLSPVSGLSNPVAPFLSMIMVDEQKVEGTVTFSAAYEGGPGLVHGGFIAAVFDELLGKVQSQLERPGLTANLTVRYIRPCPIENSYRLEGRVIRTENRKIHTESQMFMDKQLMAAAKAVFIAPG